MSASCWKFFHMHLKVSAHQSHKRIPYWEVAANKEFQMNKGRIVLSFSMLPGWRRGGPAPSAPLTPAEMVSNEDEVQDIIF